MTSGTAAVPAVAPTPIPNSVNPPAAMPQTAAPQLQPSPIATPDVLIREPATPPPAERLKVQPEIR